MEAIQDAFRHTNFEIRNADRAVNKRLLRETI